MGTPVTRPAPRPTRRFARPPSPRPRLLLLVNPRASSLRDGELAAARKALATGFAVRTVPTEERGHARELARDAAAAGYDLVAVAGGDGTTSEAAGGLCGSPVALTCLPTGCTNVIARSLGTPRGVVGAAERLASVAAADGVRSRAIDLGLVNGRPFVSMAGVGFSASMTAKADDAAHRKAHLGQLHFWSAAASELGRRYLRNPPRMRIEAAGQVTEGVTAMVQNSHALTYFGPREIAVCEGAGLETGSLGITSLRRVRPGDLPSVVGRLVTGRAAAVTGHPQVDAIQGAATATITSLDGEPLPVEADGEYLGAHPVVELGVAAGALRVVV